MSPYTDPYLTEPYLCRVDTDRIETEKTALLRKEVEEVQRTTYGPYMSLYGPYGGWRGCFLADSKLNPEPSMEVRAALRAEEAKSNALQGQLEALNLYVPVWIRIRIRISSVSSVNWRR